MNAYLPKILTTYNNRGATPGTHEARKTLFRKAFRASFTLGRRYTYRIRILFGSVKSWDKVQ